MDINNDYALEKEANEYFHHNPHAKKVYFVMVTEEVYDELNEYHELDVIATFNNKEGE